MSTKRKTILQVKKTIMDLVGDEYTLESTEYKNNKQKMIFRHYKDNGHHDFEMTTKDFIHGGNRCPICWKEKLKLQKNRRKNLSDIKKELHELVGSEYEIVSDNYTNSRTKITFKHNLPNNHSHLFEMMWNDFQQGHRCSNCRGHQKTEDDVNYIIEENTKGEYKLNKIINKKEILIEHCECGTVFKRNYHSFLRNRSCVCLKCFPTSKGEEIIERYLKEHNYEYEREVKLEGCKFKRHLLFDFCVKNKGEKILIEFDGQQHFIPTRGNKEFFLTLQRDKKKDEYCMLNNLKLIRIHYLQKSNIAKILDRELMR